ncbi:MULTISPECIES: hypothetical protein [Laceyella]|jgi:hypothetical protein|uniref:PrgI family protein n=1 Tax=Laceyella sacchari TaxID=37482 RepID=A0ABY5U7J1_LACSH|nr:hypothetical protein [Laceyella sacchari]KPC73956.1 hypothetical protein ADL26_13055 [Thermoactinomyces vulgaris]MRG27048.1 hypothetical protein [Laceyella tengchongensis]TCW40650.1 hypothetical protein EDC32_101296 [Laceyella sacchari]UWE04292.1 hypothetical protein NYR52_03805 [Laceyella sacchari]
MRYTIPRNVKKGQSFLGLEFKGWIYFAPTAVACGAIGWGCYLLTQTPVAGVMVAGTLGGMFFYLFMTDERSGAMNGAFLIDILKWAYSQKVRLYWGEQHHGEKIDTLKIRVDLKKRERE